MLYFAHLSQACASYWYQRDELCVGFPLPMPVGALGDKCHVLLVASPWEPNINDMSYSQWVRDARRNPCGGREAMVLLSVVLGALCGFSWLQPVKRKEDAKQRDASSSGMNTNSLDRA